MSEQNNLSANKRIAKNTILLYFRMLLLFVVNFYMTRVLLQVLGIDDFGLYNVVAGFVAMLGFINTSMTNSIQRFINFQLGKEGANGVKPYFETSMTTQLVLGGIMFFLFETGGLWFLNNKMNIPDGRHIAANIIYQAACLCTMVGFIRSPYNALIIAKEKMDFYAYISIGEAILKVAIIFVLPWCAFDKLSLYGIFLFIITAFTLICSIIYCRKIFPQIRFRCSFDKKIIKEVLSFSGWNLFGSISGTIKSQGINILMNMFFSVAVNAARGVAFQVLSGIQQFVSNFQLAINPQIVQSYSIGNKERYLNLTYLSAKISVYLMWVISLPMLLCIDDILALWLGTDNIPNYTNLFVIIILFTGLFDSLGSSISISLYATGKIKTYQIVVSCIKILVLPISYLLYRTGYAPVSSMYISLILASLEQTIRVIIWGRLVKESPWIYLRKIGIRALVVICLSFLIAYIINNLIPDKGYLFHIIVTLCYSIPITLGFVYTVGLNNQEKKHVSSIITSYTRTGF